MNAQELYKKLDNDFELDELKDDWSKMDFNEFISENFKKRYMGLVLDNSREIKKVYTVVFPSNEVLEKILSFNEKDILLFTHHPMDWDSSAARPFRSIDKSFLKKFKANSISLYNLHAPLDKNGKYSTSVNLAKALDINVTGELGEYEGIHLSVIGETKCQTTGELVEKVESAVGHKVKLWNYGFSEIKDKKVALCAGGVYVDEIKELVDMGINTLVTGIIKPNNNYPPSLEAHRVAKENKINIIGATHYSTEKFACMEMVDYFSKLGFPSQFIEGKPDLDDLE